MTNKISRRQFIKGASAGTFALGFSALSAGKLFASPPGQETVTLRFQENAENYSGVVNAFRELFPNVNIEFVNVTGIDHAEIATRIMTQFAAGQPIDVGYAATEATQFYAGLGLAGPMTERVLADQDELAEYFADVSPTLVEGMMWEGNLYQIPRDFNAAHIYFNKQLMDEAGLEVPGEE